MTRNKPLVDLGIGALLGLFILIISPGAAIIAILALLVLLGYGLNRARGARRRRRRVRRQVR